MAFLTADWPLPVFVKCTKHLNPPVAAGSRPDAGPGQRPPPPPVAVGSRVVAKHKNGRYYWGQVVESRSQDFYAVDFEDNSSCDNLRPSDVVVSAGSSASPLRRCSEGTAQPVVCGGG